MFFLFPFALAQDIKQTAALCHKEIDTVAQNNECFNSYIKSISSFYQKTSENLPDILKQVNDSSKKFCGQDCATKIEEGFKNTAAVCGEKNFPSTLFSNINKSQEYITFQSNIFASFCGKAGDEFCASSSFNYLYQAGAFNETEHSKWFDGARKIFSPMGFAKYFTLKTNDTMMCSTCPKQLYTVTVGAMQHLKDKWNTSSDPFKNANETLASKVDEKCKTNNAERSVWGISLLLLINMI